MGFSLKRFFDELLAKLEEDGEKIDPKEFKELLKKYVNEEMEYAKQCGQIS